jgi:hypothetical protein
LLSGAWDVEVTHRGRTLEPTGKWQQTCWCSDDDVDYLELSLELSHGVELERHILLTRKDRVLFLADAILGSASGEIEYRSRLPLSGFSRFEPEAETREGSLFAGRKAVARVLPLALPEWRAQRCRGELKADGDALQLQLASEKPRLFAPLLVDLDTERLRREVTWRQLTVAEDRENVPADVAVGYRVQLHHWQWIIYRSLAKPAIRSLVSKSLMHQFLFGVFSPSGLVDPLLEIDPT